MALRQHINKHRQGVFLCPCRKQETEADAIGVMLAARACFDPKAAIIVFTKLGKKEKEMLHGARVPQFMLTHPLSEVGCELCFQCMVPLMLSPSK